jgi:hypothetical protein
MSLINFLSNIKNKRIGAQLESIKNYKIIHKCDIYLMYHDKGVLVMDANKGICISDLIIA